MILYTGESEAIGISPTPIDFIEEQELFIHDSDGTYPLVSSYSFNIPLSVAKCFLKIFSTENGSY